MTDLTFNFVVVAGFAIARISCGVFLHGMLKAAMMKKRGAQTHLQLTMRERLINETPALLTVMNSNVSLAMKGAWLNGSMALRTRCRRHKPISLV